MNDPQPSTNRNRYLPTRENFILRVKELLYELALQTTSLREQPRQEDTPLSDRQESSAAQD